MTSIPDSARHKDEWKTIDVVLDVGILRQDPAHDVPRKIILPHVKGVERVMQEDNT